MKKNKSLGYEIFMTALVLVIIAGVAGALLGLVNYYTEVSEAEMLARKATAVYDGELKAYTQSSGISGTIDVPSAKILGVFVPKDADDTNDVYVIRAQGSGAYKGTLELLINITGGEIVKIAAYDADETPGLGSKALTDNFFSKYYGKDLNDEMFEGFVLTKKDASADNEVKGVTGATKSSTAVTNAVNAAVKWYKIRVLGGEQ